MGFRWRRTKENRRVLVEKPFAVADSLLQEEAQSARYRTPVRLYWRDLDRNGLPSKKMLAEQWHWRDTVPMQQGSVAYSCSCWIPERFVAGAELVYKASSSTGDYHIVMNADNFTKWLTQQLLPNLEAPSAIVTDNASYHIIGLTGTQIQTNGRQTFR